MKGIGKTYKLNTQYPKVKFTTSTQNRNTLKAFTYELKFWFDKEQSDDPRKDINDLFKRTGRLLLSEGQYHFDSEKFIAVKDIPNDLGKSTKKVFIQFEYTLFPKHKLVNDTHVSTIFTDITNVLYKTFYHDRNEISVSK